MEFVGLKKNYMKVKEQEAESRKKSEYYDNIATELRYQLVT